MWHGLAAVRAVVDHDAVSGIGDTLIASDFGGGEQQVTEQRLVVILRHADARDYPFGHDEEVDGGLRRNVAKCETIVVLVDDVRRDLAVTDLFEERFFCHEGNVHSDSTNGKGRLVKTQIQSISQIENPPEILPWNGSKVDPPVAACEYFYDMKILTALTTCAALAMVSCETMNGPVASGDFDPLQTPGSQIAKEDSGATQRIRPGQFVVAAIDNTAFYNQQPGSEAEADKLLSRGTSMKVISISGSLFRVELDSGEVGFVPGVMLEDPDTMSDDPDVPFDLYPAGFQAEPDLPLPEGLPGEDIPDVIEPVIEPAVPPAVEPLPEVEPTPLPDI